MNRTDDAQLVAAAGAGDMGALGELVRRHQQRALRLAYRILGDWHAAEDVAQEAFMRVARGARDYRPQGKFTTWLHRIVVNLCLDDQRRSARRPVAVEDPEGPQGRDAPGPERKEASQLVRRAVFALPERQKVVVLLSRYEGMRHSEIAEVTGWSVSAVESLLVRAYANLREALAGLEEG